MQISQPAANNRTHFEDHFKGFKQYLQNHLLTAKENDLQLTLTRFSTQQSFDPSKSCASGESTPRKNSGYSTHEDEQSFEEDLQEVCEEFSKHGCCMKGAGCELLHQARDKNAKKEGVKVSVMSNFPEFLGMHTGRRVISFLA